MKKLITKLGVMYVNARNGSDANAGNSPSTPWKHSPRDPRATGFAACARVTLAILLIAWAVTLPAQTQQHQATLTWGMSPDQVIDPTLAMVYNVYRLNGACPADGSYSLATATKLSANQTGLTFVDTNVKVAQTYCYAVTASLNGAESGALPAPGTIPLAKIPVTVGTK